MVEEIEKAIIWRVSCGAVMMILFLKRMMTQVKLKTPQLKVKLVVKYTSKHEQNWFFKVWVIIVCKDLSIVYYASPPRYNRNFLIISEDQN